MAILPRAFINPKKIESSIRRVERALKPDVVRVRYNLGEDWTGDPSIFFRVVLSDEASREAVLRQSAQRATDVILKEVPADDLGLNAYFNFRSFSETKAMKEADWE